MYKLPKGKSDYRELREENYVYIDKTKYIEMLENSNDSYVHFLRPRRFGKTLFTSMLSYYYDLAMKEKFQSLFGPCSPFAKGTYIYDHPTPNKNNYYIMNFNFSGLSDKRGKELENAFHFKVYKTLENFCEKYDLDIKPPYHMDAAQTLFSVLKDFSIHNKTNQKIYLMVDEYDHFANDLLSFSLNEFKKATQSDGFIRSFFEEIKAGAETVISRVFITGVSPITLDSLTSGYNISTNLSLDPRFNEMMGFTSEEMMHLISMVKQIEEPENTLLEMKQIYDGYMFSRDGDHHVFNPNMALYYLDYYQSFQKPPLEIVDPNIYSDYKKIENLLNIKPDKNQRIALNEIISGNDVLVMLTMSYNLNKRFTRDDFVSLLYYLGYLTISGTKGMRIKLSVPNDVIRNVYFDYFKEMLSREMHIDTGGYIDAMDNILYEKDNALFVSQMEGILASLDNRDYIGLQEKGTKIAAMAIANTNASVLVKSEYAVPGGYIDLVFFPYQTDGATSLIELRYCAHEAKYIKKEDCTEENIHKKREEAYAQLQRYQQAKEFEKKDLVKWILIFSKEKCVWNELIA